MKKRFFQIFFVLVFLLGSSFTVSAQRQTAPAIDGNDQRASVEVFVEKYSSFSAAKAEADATGKTLVFSGTTNFNGNETITAPVRVLAGGKLNVASGATLNLQGIFEAPPVQVFAGAGNVNLSQSKVQEIYPEWFAPANAADWAPAIHKASTNLILRGGVVKFACNKTYTVATPVVLDGTRNYTWRGCQNDFGYQSSILYTGSGTSSAFSFRSSYGIRLENLVITYNNAAFTGTLIDFSDNAALVDSASYTIFDSVFQGTGTAAGATMIDLSGSIIGRVEKVHFNSGAIGIRGIRRAAGKDETNVVTIEKCAFNGVETAIMNVSSNWRIINNTFEPNRNEFIKAVGDDCNSLCKIANGVEFSGNYLADNTLQTVPFVKFVLVHGLTISGNWWYHDSLISRAAITLDNAEGVHITGNSVRGVTNLIETVGAPTRNIYIAGNRAYVPNMVLQTAPVIGLTVFEPIRHGNGSGNYLDRLSVQGAMQPTNNSGHLNFGMKSDEAADFSGKISILARGAYGARTNALGIFAPQFGADGEINFFTNNTRRAWLDGTGFRSTLPILFNTDNSVDIGASGATRPRTGYFGTSVVAPSFSFNAQSNLSRYTSVSANDAVKLTNTSAGASLGIQNVNAAGFSGVEYFDNDGNVAVFTGYKNGGTGEFRFNNITANGFISFKINNSDKLVVANSGNVGIGLINPGAYKLNVNGTGYFSGQLVSAKFALTDTATIAIDWNSGNTQTVTLAGNRTFTFANPIAGARYTLFLKQDAAGGRTASFPAGILWQNGTAPVLTSAAGKTDIITIYYDGSKYYGKAELNF
jgi:hypothetical protein